MKKIRVNIDDNNIEGLETVSFSVLINSLLKTLTLKDKVYISSLQCEYDNVLSIIVEGQEMDNDKNIQKQSK